MKYYQNAEKAKCTKLLQLLEKLPEMCYNLKSSLAVGEKTPANSSNVFGTMCKVSVVGRIHRPAFPLNPPQPQPQPPHPKSSQHARPLKASPNEAGPAASPSLVKLPALVKPGPDWKPSTAIL